MGRTHRVLWISVCLAACGGPAAPTQLRRTVGGESRLGAFVSPYSYEWYLRGELALSSGDLDLAEAAFRRARTGPEDDPFVLSRLVHVLEQKQQPQRALRTLESGLATFPNSEALWLAAGGLHERQHRIIDAIRAYEQAERVTPQSERAPRALARLLSRSGRKGRAQAILRRYIARAGEVSPGALRAQLDLALERGDGTAAARAIGRLLAIAPARSSEVLAAAQAALNDGHATMAAKLLDAVPRRLGTVALRARALIDAGRREEAESIVTLAAPDQFADELDHARWFIQVGRADRAEEIAARVALLERTPEAWLVRGQARFKQAQYVSAALDFARVPRGARGYAAAHVGLSRALAAQSLMGLAAEVLATALRGGTDDEPTIRTDLAGLRLRMGNRSGALQVVESLGDGSPSAQVLRARTLERAGRPGAANEAWARLNTRRLPRVARLRAGAERRLADGDVDGAIRRLRLLSALDPVDLWARARLAEALDHAGDTDRARAVAQAAWHITTDEGLRAHLTERFGAF